MCVDVATLVFFDISNDFELIFFFSKRLNIFFEQTIFVKITMQNNYIYKGLNRNMILCKYNEIKTHFRFCKHLDIFSSDPNF